MAPGVDLNIGKELWKEYQKLCIDLGESASLRISRFMREELEKVERQK